MNSLKPSGGDRSRRVVTAILSAALTLLFAGPPATFARDDCADAWITAKVKTKLLGKGPLGAFKVNIDTDECAVTLRGCVDTDARGQEAAKIARGVKGVTSVSNELTICEGKVSEVIGDECPDAIITAEVKSLILALEGFSAFSIDVDTEECVVTLEGCVDSGDQKEEAVRAARKAKGAKEVHSQLSICAD